MKKRLIIGVFCFLLLIGLGFRTFSSKESKRFVVARDPSWYPFEVLGREKNILALSDQITREFALKNDLQLVFMSLGPNNLELALIRGDCEAILSSLPVTPLRSKVLSFSDPYFYVGPMLIVPRTSKVESLEDMQDKTIGVLMGDLLPYNVGIYPTVVIEMFDSKIKALDALFRGDVDGVVMDALPAYFYSAGVYKETFKVVGEPLTNYALRLITSQKNEDLIEKFNLSLKNLKDSGRYQELLERWGLYNP
jgi:polar amino acid transport system substrate-binding protein